MGLLGKLIKTGIAAGVAYTAVKINEKYKAENPYGADPAQKADALKHAAGEVYQEFSEIAKEKAPGIKAEVETAAQKGVEFAKKHAPSVVDKVQTAAETVSVKAQEFANSLNGNAVDADFEPIIVEENKDEE